MSGATASSTTHDFVPAPDRVGRKLRIGMSLQEWLQEEEAELQQQIVDLRLKVEQAQRELGAARAENAALSVRAVATTTALAQTKQRQERLVSELVVLRQRACRTAKEHTQVLLRELDETARLRSQLRGARSATLTWALFTLLVTALGALGFFGVYQPLLADRAGLRRELTATQNKEALATANQAVDQGAIARLQLENAGLRSVIDRAAQQQPTPVACVKKAKKNRKRR